MTSGVCTPIQGELAGTMAGIDQLADIGPSRPATTLGDPPTSCQHATRAITSNCMWIHMTSGVRTSIQGDLAEIMARIDEVAEFGPIRPVTAPIKAIWPRYWLVLTNWPMLAQLDR